MWRVGAVSGIIAALVLSGCAADVDEDAAELDVDADGPASTAASADPAENASVPAKPYPLTFWFTSDGTFSTTAPTAGKAPMTESFLDPAGQVGGFDIPTFTASALEGPVRITAGKATLLVATDTPQLSFLPGTPMLLWLGSPGAPGSQTPMEGPSPMMPGTTTFTKDLTLPPGGRVLTAERPLVAMIGYFYGPTEQTPLNLLVGPEASRLEVTVEPIELPKLGEVKETKVSGEVGTANGIVEMHGVPTMFEQEVVVAAETVLVEVSVKGRAAAGRTDLDLYFNEASGKLIESSTSPNADEAIALYSLNLKPGTYKASVVNFQGIQSTFDMVVKVYAAA